MSKSGFTGTQEGMTEQQKDTLRLIFEVSPPDEFHHGDCIGADAEAHQIAREHGIPIVIHPPTDSRKRAFCEGAIRVEDPLPYMERNQAIVDATDELIATPKGFQEEVRSGTWATIRRGWKKYPVTIIKPDGSME